MSRNWKEYNSKLVKRGEFYLLADFIEHWDEELDKMNKNKRGSPFEFPQSFIDYAAFLKTVFNQPYRQLQGITQKLSLYIPGLKSAEYTTLWRRIRATEFELEQLEAVKESKSEDESEGVIVAVDATGMKVTNRGEWMREIADERVGDSKEFKNLIEQAEFTLNGRKIALVLADAAHDSKENFNRLKKKNITSGIKMRKNASTRSRGSPYNINNK